MIQSFTRATFPDHASLYPAVAAAIGSQFILFQDFRDDGTKPVLIDKATPWLPAELTAVQNAVTNAPAAPLPLQTEAFTIREKAIVLALIDEINVIRTELNTLRAAVSPPLTPALPPRTPAQAITAIRTKAGTL